MNKPLILAHRGASAVAPENTIAAFRAARDLGADGIELDVTLTRDHVSVVIHDDTVDRTTNGHGRVSDMNLSELKRLDAGGWKGTLFQGEAIPTLAEVFAAIEGWTRAQGQNPGAVINVELKSTTILSDGLEALVLKEIEQVKLEERVIISSFNPLALARVKGLNPGIMRGLLYDLDLPIYLRRAWLRPIAAPQALHPRHAMIDVPYMLWAGRKGLSINTWTVDEPREARRLAGIGVNAIITNQPDTIRLALA